MNLKNISGSILVAGLGKSGCSVCSVLRGLGVGNARINVIGFDEHAPDADVSSFDAIDWSQIALVVTSPVFDPRTDFLVRARELGIPVWSEVEFAWQTRVNRHNSDSPAPWIAITGTNGKTTTTQMVSFMLERCGLVCPAVGNIGIPVSGASVDPRNDALAVELSSFQLHFTDSLESAPFEPVCAVITNIAADHLDWHGGWDDYVASKAKVFAHVRKALVYNVDDPISTRLAQEAVPARGCQRIGFTLHEPRTGQIGVENGVIVDNRSGVPRALTAVTSLVHLTEPNGSVYPHLLADALAALSLCIGFGMDSDALCQALASFTVGDHRIQLVGKTQVVDAAGTTVEVRFIDDSKATNAHAALASLSSFRDKSVVWIAGGLAKGGTFGDLVEAADSKIVYAVVIGKEQEPMVEALQARAADVLFTQVSPDSTRVMADAIDGAMEYVVERGGNGRGVDGHNDDSDGYVVLLAPACASMDQFISYADRGNQFTKAAAEWVTKTTNAAKAGDSDQ